MHTTQSLQAEITHLRAIFARGDFDDMPALLLEHDQHLRDYCQTSNVQANKAELKKLHGMQHDLIRLMRERQRKLLELMRQQRHSHQASVAYASIGRI